MENNIKEEEEKTYRRHTEDIQETYRRQTR